MTDPTDEPGVVVDQGPVPTPKARWHAPVVTAYDARDAESDTGARDDSDGAFS